MKEEMNFALSQMQPKNHSCAMFSYYSWLCENDDPFSLVMRCSHTTKGFRRATPRGVRRLIASPSVHPSRRPPGCGIDRNLRVITRGYGLKHMVITTVVVPAVRMALLSPDGTLSLYC